MAEKSLKNLLFMRCLALEAASHKAKKGASDSIGKVTAAGGANALRAVIRDAGMEEEYRSFYYSLALRAAEENLKNEALEPLE